MSALDNVLSIGSISAEHPRLHADAVAELAALRADRDALAAENEQLRAVHEHASAFIAEWSERFGFLAAENPRASLASIDEVANILGDKIALAARVERLTEELKNMLYIFDRDLPVGSIGRITCDSALFSIKDTTNES